MRSILLAAVLVAICSQAFADVWIVTNKGIWKIDGGVPVKVTSSNDRVIIDGVDVPDDPDDPDPDPTNVAEKVKAISKEKLRSKDEARAVLAVVRVFQRDGANLTRAREGLSESLNVVGRLFAGNKFDEWFAAVDDLQAGAYTRSFIDSIEKGLSEAFTLPAGSMSEADVRQLFLQAKSQEQITFLQIILRIIELLIELGILGG